MPSWHTNHILGGCGNTMPHAYNVVHSNQLLCCVQTLCWGAITMAHRCSQLGMMRKCAIIPCGPAHSAVAERHRQRDLTAQCSRVGCPQVGVQVRDVCRVGVRACIVCVADVGAGVCVWWLREAPESLGVATVSMLCTRTQWVEGRRPFAN